MSSPFFAGDTSPTPHMVVLLATPTFSLCAPGMLDPKIGMTPPPFTTHAPTLPPQMNSSTAKYPLATMFDNFALQEDSSPIPPSPPSLSGGPRPQLSFVPRAVQNSKLWMEQFDARACNASKTKLMAEAFRPRVAPLCKALKAQCLERPKECSHMEPTLQRSSESLEF